MRLRSQAKTSKWCHPAGRLISSVRIATGESSFAARVSLRLTWKLNFIKLWLSQYGKEIQNTKMGFMFYAGRVCRGLRVRTLARFEGARIERLYCIW